MYRFHVEFYCEAHEAWVEAEVFNLKEDALIAFEELKTQTDMWAKQFRVCEVLWEPRKAKNVIKESE